MALLKPIQGQQGYMGLTKCMNRIIKANWIKADAMLLSEVNARLIEIRGNYFQKALKRQFDDFAATL